MQNSLSQVRRADLIGSKYGRLTVLSKAESHPRKGRMWVCKCKCGTLVEKDTSCLIRGNTKSCGCLFKEQLKTRHYKRTGCDFNVTKKPEYRIWMKAKQRCENPNDKGYRLYGVRGIEMRLTFKEFFEYLGPRPSAKHSVDRINVNGHYERGNIRWATPRQQATNQRHVLNGGVYQRPNGRWIAAARWKGKQVHLGTFDTYEEAKQKRKESMVKYEYGI